MIKKLPKYLYRSWLLSLILLFALSGTISAQSEQFPAAYYNPSWTVNSERTNGVGEVTLNAIDPSSFILPNTSISRSPERNQVTVVYDNGPHINMPGIPDLSLLESTTLSMNTLGGNISHSAGYGVADDFELVAETEITSISVYAYQTGATSTSINAMYVTIWDGDPSDVTSSIVWGNSTTNVFSSVENSAVYRVSETDMGGRTRLIQKVNASISGLTLDAGTYWLEYSLGGSVASGPWQPPVVILGETTTGNALQLVATGWQPWLDTGTNTPQGLPFQIHGIASENTGVACSQGTVSNNIENGWGNVSLLTYANDFVVAQNDEFTLEEISVNFLLNPGVNIVSADIFFYQDTGGNGPGAEILGTSSLLAVPDSQAVIGTHSAGFDLVKGVWTLDTPITFEGNASGDTVYWMGIQIEYAGANAFMETSSIYDTPNEAYFSDNGGATWTSGLVNFGADMHGVVTFSGQCELVDDGGGDIVYCTPELDCTDGDMITNVTFQEINNTTTCSPNGYGDYTAMIAVVEAGETYPISVSVGDGWSNESVSVWIDFDNSGSFEQNEFFYIGTGSDEALTGNIAIPADLANGNYRMRVRVAAVGQTTATWNMACDESQGYGETEDYTIEVGGGDVVNEYCIPVATNSSRYINNFSTTGGSENISNLGSGFSTGGYGDFTAMKVTQVQSNNVDFTVDIVGGISGFRIWVDWNQDGVFDTSEEVAYQSSGYANSHSASFTIPTDAIPGETRMRIVSHWLSTSGEVDPCVTGFTYGEFEDYTLEVVALEVCTEAVAGTVVGDTDREVCANSPFSMSVEGNSEAATGLTRTWQSSPAGAGTWTDLGVDSATITIAGINTPTDYRYHVECDNGDSDDSEVISITLNPNAEECYCIPEGTNSSRYINNFATTGGSENISNMGSGFSPNGYGDFYDTHTVAQEPGEIVEFSVDLEGGTFGFRIWVDWNQDGSFDASEEVAFATSSYQSSHTGSFTVPADALEGDTRMRIVGHWLSNSADIDPCEVGFVYGEFEDYKFTVGEGSSGDVYCTPELDCEEGDMITNVTFQEIDNTTACSPNGYGDYTDMTAFVQAGGTYPISVSVGDGWAYESVSVWIDFDNNGIFDQDEFFYIGTGSNEALIGNITIPAEVENGFYRMRVRVAADGEDGATWDMSCDEDQGFGETEDYTVGVDGAVGVNDNSTVSFSYYPNPMGDVLYITANENIQSISAYNLLGQEVLNSKHFANGKVDVSSLSTGAFLFRVTFENGLVENFKVLKK